MSGAESIFTRIYDINRWGFGSGHGSLAKVTEGYRQFVQNFILENGVRTVVDFGCGDWQFSRLMDWSAVDYLGLDVAPEVIHNNRTKYGGSKIKFELSPPRFAGVPDGDLLPVKDVLQHFPNDMIRSFMAEVVQRFRFALITNCIERARKRNREIALGSWRPLDLRASPYGYQANEVFSFSGPPKISLRPLKLFPGWRKVVLLFSGRRADASEYVSLKRV